MQEILSALSTLRIPPVIEEHALHRLIAAGSCAGFVARCDEALLPPGQISLLPLEERELSLDVYIGFKREKHLSQDAQAFASFVREYFC